MEGILALLVPFGAFLMAFGIVYVTTSAKNKEKLSMLDKGFTPQEIQDATGKKSKGQNLSTGLLFVGAASGVLIGYMMSQFTPIDLTLACITCAFLFGGIGLVIAHLIDTKKAQ